MTSLALATVIGLFTGLLGTLPGGFFVLKRPSKKIEQSWLLGFSGGVMIAIVLFDLFPEACHFGSIWSVLTGTVLGVGLVKYAESILRLIPYYQEQKCSNFVRLGVLLGLGIGVHNFPEGVALGTVYAAEPEKMRWVSLALLMAIHNLPEGMVMAAAFKLGKVRFKKIVFSLILVEIPMGIGAGVGAFLGQLSAWMISFSLAFAAGAMLILVIKELIPLARKLAGFLWVGIGLAFGCLIGILLVMIL